jgi:hypothetical protein
MNKIIQIMPAPEGMLAIYKQDDGKLFVSPIVAIGLDDEGEIHGLAMGDCGWVESAKEAVNFHSFHFKAPVEPRWILPHNLDVIKKNSDARIAKAREEEAP